MITASSRVDAAYKRMATGDRLVCYRGWWLSFPFIEWEKAPSKAPSNTVLKALRNRGVDVVETKRDDAGNVCTQYICILPSLPGRPMKQLKEEKAKECRDFIRSAIQNDCDKPMAMRLFTAALRAVRQQERDRMLRCINDNFVDLQDEWHQGHNKALRDARDWANSDWDPVATVRKGK